MALKKFTEYDPETERFLFCLDTGIIESYRDFYFVNQTLVEHYIASGGFEVTDQSVKVVNDSEMHQRTINKWLRNKRSKIKYARYE